MDVIKLDRSTYIGTDLVDGYDSLVWTERYLTPGDFTIVAAKNIDKFRSQIPEGSLLSLLDTQEVMIVESHKITTNDDGIQQLQITGRSATTILEGRQFGGELTGVYSPDDDRYQLSREACERALLFIYDSVVQIPVMPISGVDRSVGDQLPNVMTSLSRVYSANSDSSIITFGSAMDIASNLLGQQFKGLRTLRPPTSGGFLTVFNNAWGPANLATYTLISTSTTKLRFDVYDGKDRSQGNAFGFAPVTFDYGVGTLDDPSYLWSIKDYKNMMDVWTSVQEKQTVTLPGIGTPTGWDRRTSFLDASQWQQQGTDSGGVFADIASRALNELVKTQQKIWIDGAIAKNSPFKYKTDYALGDTITIRGQYGLSQNMHVTEYIRSEDATGETGFPTLVAF